MKTITKTGLMLGLMIMSMAAFGQKKTQGFTVSRVIQASADLVWAVVGEDYGAIANSHPKILSSNYINGTLEAGEGAERICRFNESGTRYVEEKIVNYDPENFTFKNLITHADKFPLNSDYSYATYKIESIDANSSRFVFNMVYRTKPAMMGGMMKGSFQKLIQDYALAIEHHLSTGEKVTVDNFKAIKKGYASR